MTVEAISPLPRRMIEDMTIRHLSSAPPPAPLAPHHPHALAGSRNRQARRRPCTSRQTHRSLTISAVQQR